MAKHNDLGKAGENAAVAYLEQKGYLIRDRNWRKGHFELDIVAAKDNELIVVEVKTRSNTLFAAGRCGFLYVAGSFLERCVCAGTGRPVARAGLYHLEESGKYDSDF